MPNNRTPLQEAQEEARFARQIRDTTDRDDAQEMVDYWEARVKELTTPENNPVKPSRRKPD